MRITRVIKITAGFLCFFCILCILVFSGDIFHPSQEASSSARIAAIIPVDSYSVWKQVWDGVRTEADVSGVSLSEYSYQTGQNADILASLLETAEWSDTEGILLCGNQVTDSSVMKILSREREKGVPIVLCESDTSPECRDAFIGFDNTKVGEQIAERIMKGPEPDRLMFLSHKNAAVPTAQTQRKEAIISKVSEKMPDIVIEDAMLEETGIDYNYAVEKKLLAHKDESVCLVSFSSSNTVQTAQILEHLGLSENVFFIGFSEDDKAYQYLESGIIDTLVTLDNTTMGKTGMHTLSELINGQTLPSDTIYLDAVFLEKGNR